ncbi:MAG TPA: hypothetical protein VMV86_00015 [Methanosarcinales archaeon]|nr:hypothetical protein [Methanosarcinales archaeon]
MTVFTNSDKIIMEKIITIEDARAIVERLPKTLEKRKVLPKNICPADEHIIKVVEENFANGETDKIWHHNSVTG